RLEGGAETEVSRKSPSGGSVEFSNVAAGDYVVRVEDAQDASCISEASDAVSVSATPSAPSAVELTVTQPSCSVTTGIIKVSDSVSASLVYVLYRLEGGAETEVSRKSPSGGGVEFSNVAAGDYVVRVEDAQDASCISEASDAVSVSATHTSALDVEVKVTQ